jgi:hypothetical protein
MDSFEISMAERLVHGHPSGDRLAEQIVWSDPGHAAQAGPLDNRADGV